MRFQSTRPLRGETQRLNFLYKSSCFQSTRPLRGETTCSIATLYSQRGFQSTRPLRGETGKRSDGQNADVSFNPLAPCGARRGILTVFGRVDVFQSTRPLRGETVFAVVRMLENLLSIHSPLAGRDGS